MVWSLPCLAAMAAWFSLYSYFAQSSSPYAHHIWATHCHCTSPVWLQSWQPHQPSLTLPKKFPNWIPNSNSGLATRGPRAHAGCSQSKSLQLQGPWHPVCHSLGLKSAQVMDNYHTHCQHLHSDEVLFKSTCFPKSIVFSGPRTSIHTATTWTGWKWTGKK
jgi:hypothetical protein